MGMIDPKKRRSAREAEGKSATPELGKGPQRINRACRIPGAVVGWEHYKSAVKGTPGLLVRFVALDEPDAGAITEKTFWLSEAALDQFADFLLALGHEEPVDPNNNDHLEVAFSRGAVMMDVKGESYTDREGNERTAYRPEWFGVYRGKGKKEWNEILKAAEEGWGRYIEWRGKNPRPEPGSGSGGSSTDTGSKQRRSRFGGDDDEIPF